MKTKKWYESKAVIGAIAVITSVISQYVGVDILDQEFTKILADGTVFIGGLVALYGRLVAKTKLN